MRFSQPESEYQAIDCDIEKEMKLNIIKYYLIILAAILISPYTFCQDDAKSNYEADPPPDRFQAISLFGEPLVSDISSPLSLENLRQAQTRFEQNPDNIENVVWYGRRTAYTGEFRRAIQIYSTGIEKFPNEPRLYRHRGHRLISIREFEAAIRDFEKALELIEGTEDVIEQDGLPNSANIPVSTLHGNIRYHLALAYYLTGRLEEAVGIYRADIAAGGSDDFLVASTHWLYMSLRRLGRTAEAAQALSSISENMKIYESFYYHELCLLYQGKTEITDLLHGESDTIEAAGRLYGIANWYSYNGDPEKTNKLFQEILDGKTWAAFGYIAAEADLARQNSRARN